MSFEFHGHLDVPPDTAQICRFLHFYKLVSLLEYRSIWFSQLRILREMDSKEGTLPAGNESLAGTEFDRRAHPTLSLIKSAGEYHKEYNLYRLYVSCWFLEGSCGNVSKMWATYADGTCGVCLRTRFGPLRSQLEACKSHHFHAGRVKYVDYESHAEASGNTHAYAYMKHAPSFSEEAEIRVTTEASKRKDSSPDTLDDILKACRDISGISIPVEPEALIEEITVRPTAASWEIDLVNRLLQKYAINSEARRDSLPL